MNSLTQYISKIKRTFKTLEFYIKIQKEEAKQYCT